MRPSYCIAIVVLVLASVLLSAVPAAVASDWWPLVPCGLNQVPKDKTLADGYTEPCNACDLLKLLKNLIDFVLYGLTPILATTFFVWAGLRILVYGADPNGISEGKRIFWNTVKALIAIMMAWLLTNTLLRSVAGDSNIADEWWKFQCRITVKEPTVPAPVPPGGISSSQCADTATLASKYNEPPQGMNAPELTALIQCVRGKVSGDLGSVYTFDNSHPTCNLTRGNRVCDASCSHAVNSCHYGGRTGSAGALAVDYGNEDIGDQIIQAAMACGAKNGRCETSSGATVACSDPSATHVHVNSASCDAN